MPMCNHCLRPLSFAELDTHACYQPPKPIIYLSGPMTGKPDFNYPAFNAAAAQLRGKGYTVENPAENGEQPNWTAYMRVAIAQMMRCDQVVMLPGWQHSRGATIERTIADLLAMPVLTVEEVL